MRSRIDLARLALAGAALAPVLVVPFARHMVMPPPAVHFWLVGVARRPA